MFEKGGFEPAPLEAAAELSPAAAGGAVDEADVLAAAAAAAITATAAVDGVAVAFSVDKSAMSGVDTAISGVVTAISGVAITGASASGVADSSAEDSVEDN